MLAERNAQYNSVRLQLRREEVELHAMGCIFQEEQSLNCKALCKRVRATDAIAELRVEYDATRSLASLCEFDLEE